MKKTLNVNIGSMAFIIDEDAYLLLNNYLDQIRTRVDSTDAEEIIEDVELRMANIFTQQKPGSSQVINIDLVQLAMSIIGSAHNFGEPRSQPIPQQKSNPSEPKKLYRSRTDKIIAGLCAGLALHFNVDVALIRVITLVLILFGGVSLWVYIILWLIIPVEPLEDKTL